jgi:hypothetical protein
MRMQTARDKRESRRQERIHQQRLRNMEHGTMVPGGVGTTDINRGHTNGFVWLKAVLSLLWGGNVGYIRGPREDIVILSTSGDREFYREGPYDSVSVQTGLIRVKGEIRKDGLDAFLRAKQVEASRTGPVEARSELMSFPRWASLSLRAWRMVLPHRRTRDQ